MIVKLKLTWFFFCFTNIQALLSQDLFEWKSGSSVVFDPNVVRGNKGEENEFNHPGARYCTMGWSDTDSNIYVFGGLGYLTSSTYGRLNDFWRFNTTSQQWAWLSGDQGVDKEGSYGPDIYFPGARTNGGTWSDSNDNFYLYGGYGITISSTDLQNDFWMYNKTSGWTLLSVGNINGYSNATYGIKGKIDKQIKTHPGSRSSFAHWTDSRDRIWLWGGFNYGVLSDLWRYTNKEGWLWISGPDTTNDTGYVTTIGESSPLNNPPARYRPLHWIDSFDNFYIYSGSYPNGSLYMSDMWVWNMNKSEWTLLIENRGHIEADYINKYLPCETEECSPGARIGSITWYDNKNKQFWLFGGQMSKIEYKNDMWNWRLENNTVIWMWVSGNSTANVGGKYIKINDKNGYIGSHSYGTGGLLYNNIIYLFGGNGYASSPAIRGEMNDLWYIYTSIKVPNDTNSTITETTTNNISTTTDIIDTTGTDISTSTSISFTTTTTTTSYSTSSQITVTEQITGNNNNINNNNESNTKTNNLENKGTIIVIGVLSSLIVLILVAIALYFTRRKLRKMKEREKEEESMQISLNNYSEGRYETLDLKAKEEIRKTGTIDFNQIKIECELGRGSYGVVYKAIYRGHPIAVKKLLNDSNLKEEFEKETCIMRNLEPHPNVVNLIGICVNPCALVLEFYPKGNLYAFIKNNEINEKQMMYIIKGISLGISHLHKQNIIHRDLAARNILLSDKLDAIVSDFGIARTLDHNSSSAQTKAEIGPLRWMAPESLENKTYSKKTDVWSFGVIVFELLTNASEPWFDLSPLHAAAAVMGGKTLVKYLPDEVNPKLRTLLADCWSFDPTDRPNIVDIYQRIELIDNPYQYTDNLSDSPTLN